MAFLGITAWVVLIQLNFAAAQGTECPACTNKYDHNSCTQTQPCGTDWNYCELMVKPDDFYSLEYVCKQALECTNEARTECHPSINETCVYCCDDPVTCQLQRDDLYNFEFPASGLLVPTATSEYPAVSTRPNPSSTTTDKQEDGHQTTSPVDFTTTNSTHTTASTIGDTAGIQCPVCSDAYNHTTCSESQKCDLGIDTVCQLIILTTGLLRLEYQCQDYQVCIDREARGCHPEVNATCVYCCSELITCQLQRDDLFTYELPSLGLATNISEITTVPPPPTTPPPTTKPTTIPQPPTTTSSEIRCLQCGNFAEHISCTQVEEILTQPEACPESLPYCFTSFTQNGTDLLVYKGCATENFCSLEYELSSTKTECTHPDITLPGHVSCGYCCNHHGCNAALKPEDSWLVQFP